MLQAGKVEEPSSSSKPMRFFREQAEQALLSQALVLNLRSGF
jgi:hypothetical protein